MQPKRVTILAVDTEGRWAFQTTFVDNEGVGLHVFDAVNMFKNGNDMHLDIPEGAVELDLDDGRDCGRMFVIGLDIEDPLLYQLEQFGYEVGHELHERS